MSKHGRRLSPAHLEAIELAPQRYREALASNAAAGCWSVELTERMAGSLGTMRPEQAAEALRDPAVPVRPAEEGPEKGAPMVALESVLRNQGPPHLNPIRARLAVRSFVAAAGKLRRFDPDLALSGFSASDWTDLERDLAHILGQVMELQAALERVRSGRPHLMGPGR